MSAWSQGRKAVMMLEAVLLALSLVDAASLLVSVYKAPYPSVVPLGSPTAYRIIYIHVPISIASYTLFFLAFISALYYLARGSWRAERLAHASILVGIAYGAATLATGMVWASESWGSPWNWDPRETGVLLMWVAYLAYAVLRRSIADPETAPRISMAYAVAAFITVPISFALPYAASSLHPVARETASFISRSSLVAALFPLRMAVVVLAAVLLALLLHRRLSGFSPSKLFYAAPVVLIVAAAACFGALEMPPGPLKAAPSSPVRFSGLVVNGSLSDGGILLSVLSGDRLVKVVYEGPPPIRPLTVYFGDRKVLTLEKHTVIVEGVFRNGVVEASSLRVLLYWGVPLDALLYSVFYAAAALLAARRPGGAER